MDNYVEHTLRLRVISPARMESASNHTFEITAALCIALMGATCWAVLGAGWVTGGGGAVVVAVAALIEAGLLARVRSPRLVSALAAPVLGFLTIAVATLGAMPLVIGQTGDAAAARFVRALIVGIGSTQAWDFTVGLSAILFLIGYWLGWVALREHRGALAVVPVFGVLATNVVNAPNPGQVALPETIALVLAVAVMSAAHFGSLGADWRSERITALDGIRWRFGSSAVVVAIVLTMVAVLLPPATSANISARLFPHALGISAIGTKKAGLPTRTGGASGVGFDPVVQLGNPPLVAPQPVLTYTDDIHGYVYLRLTSETQFEDGNWLPPTQETANESEAEYSGGAIPRGPQPADETTVTVRVVMQGSATMPTSPLLPFAGDPVSASLPWIAYGTTDPSRPDALLTVDQVVPQQEILPGSTLQTTAMVSIATAAQLRAAGMGYPAWTAQYTALGAASSREVGTIRTLANAWVIGQTNPYDEAMAIEQHLRDPRFFRFTLGPPPTPKGVWPVVYFLTTSHAGYGEYFASAMGSMLRSLGIPARLVSGYGPGTTESGNGDSATPEHVVTTADAHTWVEAYFPGYGWIPFEPTPASPEGDYQPIPRGIGAVTAPQPTPTPFPEPVRKPTPKPTPAPTLTPVPSSSLTPSATSRPEKVVPRGHSAAGGPKPGAGIAAAVIIAIGVLATIGGLVLAALTWFALPRTLVGAWRRVEALGALSGVDRQEADTHRAYAARLAHLNPRAAPALSELAEMMARAEFSAAGATTSDRLRAQRVWRRAFRSFVPRRLKPQG